MKFKVFGPFEIPITPGTRSVNRKQLNEFWKEINKRHEGLSAAVGCYIFSISKAAIPYYVGLASKQIFSKEAFTDSKLLKYTEAMQKKKSGLPYLTLLARMTDKNKFSGVSKNGHPDIKFVETMLIVNCKTRNPKLDNKANTAMPTRIVVPGFLNSGAGQPPKAVQNFKKLIGS